MSAAPWSGRTPRQWQIVALDRAQAAESLLISAPTGVGKSLLLAEIAAASPGSILVTVPTRRLVNQLASDLEARCPGQVGRAFTDAWETDRRIVVCCLPSLARLAEERPIYDHWLVDEAHGVESDRLRAVRSALTFGRRIGFTATPFRGDTRGLLDWSDVFAITRGQAEDDGVIVPFRVVRWEGEGSPDIERLTAEYVAAAEGPGVVTARSIADAEETAERLGLVAVHSKQPAAEQAARLARVERGEVRGFVHVNLVTEGVDLPWLRWIVLRAAVGSRRKLVQQIGRAVRVFGDKREAVIYDPSDIVRTVGIHHPPALEDEERGEGVKIEALRGHPTARMSEAAAVAWWEGWAFDALRAFRDRNMAPVLALFARKDACPEPFRAALDRLLPVAARLPEDLRAGPAWLAAREGLTKGAAADVAGVLRVVAEHGWGEVAGG